MSYCIYSNQNIEENLMNPEHIIPLSLGGCDDFTIMVSSAKNSEVNQKIDAKMNCDFITAFRNLHHGYKGHSKKEPTIKVKKATIEGDPISVHITKSKIDAFDVVNKEHLSGQGNIRMSFVVDPSIRAKFIAKVALSAGYFMFDKIFVENADHDSLRTFIFTDNDKMPKLDLRFFDEFQAPGVLDIPKSNMWETNRIISSRIKSSGVIWGYVHNRIIAHVFICSRLIGLVNFSADVNAFRMDNDVHDDLGSVLRVESNKIFTQTPYRCETQNAMQYVSELQAAETKLQSTLDAKEKIAILSKHRHSVLFEDLLKAANLSRNKFLELIKAPNIEYK